MNTTMRSIEPGDSTVTTTGANAGMMGLCEDDGECVDVADAVGEGV